MGGMEYVLVADYCTRFLEVAQLETDHLSQTVTEYLEHFCKARHPTSSQEQ